MEKIRVLAIATVILFLLSSYTGASLMIKNSNNVENDSEHQGLVRFFDFDLGWLRYSYGVPSGDFTILDNIPIEKGRYPVKVRWHVDAFFKENPNKDYIITFVNDIKLSPGFDDDDRWTIQSLVGNNDEEKESELVSSSLFTKGDAGETYRIKFKIAILDEDDEILTLVRYVTLELGEENRSISNSKENIKHIEDKDSNIFDLYFFGKNSFKYVNLIERFLIQLPQLSKIIRFE